MKYRMLANTGLYVSELSLGAMGYGSQSSFWKQIGDLTQSDVDAQIGQALDAGVNLIDTSNYYSSGGSERAIGDALRNLGVKRDDVLLSTKVRLRMGEGPNEVGLSRHHILNSVEDSLSRLRSERIDLLYLHGPDPYTPIEETLRALDDLIRTDKVRYIGMSNFPAWKMMQAIARADRLGMNRFCATQNYYSVLTRDVETDIVPLCFEESLGLIVWSPLAGGFLARTEDTSDAKRRDEFNFPPIPEGRGQITRETLAQLCQKLDCSPATLSVAYLLHKQGISSVTIAAKSQQQLEQSLAATSIELTAEMLAQLDNCSPPVPTYPAWMQARIVTDRQAGALTTARLNSVPK